MKRREGKGTLGERHFKTQCSDKTHKKHSEVGLHRKRPYQINQAKPDQNNHFWLFIYSTLLASSSQNQKPNANGQLPVWLIKINLIPNQPNNAPTTMLLLTFILCTLSMYLSRLCPSPHLSMFFSLTYCMLFQSSNDVCQKDLFYSIYFNLLALKIQRRMRPTHETSLLLLFFFPIYFAFS